MPTGRVKFYHQSKGYGFIREDDKTWDVFFSYRALEEAGLESIGDGQRVSFEIEKDERGTGKSVAVRLGLLQEPPMMLGEKEHGVVESFDMARGRGTVRSLRTGEKLLLTLGTLYDSELVGLDSGQTIAFFRDSDRQSVVNIELVE